MPPDRVPAVRPNPSGASPAERINLSKSRYEVRTPDGSTFIFTIDAAKAEEGIAERKLQLVRSGGGDYLIARPTSACEVDRQSPGLGVMAPATTERPRDNGRYIAGNYLKQHRGELDNGRFGPRSGLSSPRKRTG